MKAIDELKALMEAADLDPLKACRIVSPGYTEFANLVETIEPGRARCVGMMPHQWAELLAGAFNALPLLLAVAEAAEEYRKAVYRTHGAEAFALWELKAKWETLLASLAALERKS